MLKLAHVYEELQYPLRGVSSLRSVLMGGDDMGECVRGQTA
jgi:hypothetical protein